MATSIEQEVQSTKNWGWTRAYNLQIPPETHETHFSDVSHGEYLLVQAKHDDAKFSLFAKVDLEEVGHLDSDKVGIGLNLRYALGVSTGDEVHVVNESPPNTSHKKLDWMLGKRPVLCRVRKAVHPDIGFEVCRLSESTMDALGITPGDNVKIESSRKSLSLKALPLREEISDRKRNQMKQNSDRYPDPVDVLDIEEIADSEIDIPEIYLDSQRREELELGAQSNAADATPKPLASGVCQPVKVTRDATSCYIRSLNEVSVPVIVGLLATIFVFEPWLNLAGNVVIIGLSLLLILFSIMYRVRKTTLA